MNRLLQTAPSAGRKKGRESLRGLYSLSLLLLYSGGLALGIAEAPIERPGPLGCEIPELFDPLFDAGRYAVLVLLTGKIEDTTGY